MRARTWPAWYYLIGNHATDKFDNRARAAQEAPFDRNVEKQMFFKGSASAREQKFQIQKNLWFSIVSKSNFDNVWEHNTFSSGSS